MPAAKNRWWQIALRIAFALLAAGCVALTVHRTGADVWQSLAECDIAFLVTAVLVYGLMQVLAAWRWQGLLAVHGLHFTLWEMLRLTLAGCFFNILLPGAVSGDIFKIAFATQRYPGRKTELVMGVLMDRAVGVCGMFFAGLLAVLPIFGNVLEMARRNWVVALCLCIVLSGCLGISIVLWLALRLGGGSQPAAAAMQEEHGGGLKETIRRLLMRVKACLYAYRREHLAVWKALAMSIVIHTMNAVVLFTVGRALHEGGLTPVQYNVSMQLSNVAGLVPLMPGGIGLRDLLASCLLDGFSGGEIGGLGGSIPVVYTLILVAWGVCGAWLAASLSMKRSEKEELTKETKL